MASAGPKLRRFSVAQRLFHLGLILLFMLLSATGLGWMFIETPWGRELTGFFGGYAATLSLHRIAGLLMLAGFAAQIAYLLAQADWSAFPRSLVGPDSLVWTFRDLRDFFAHAAWIVGIGRAPRFERWSWWEKFDYWAVWWGLIIVGVTGLMIYEPVLSSEWLPGWMFNVALWIHRIEALLAMGHIFTVHFFVEHFRPHCFPFSATMFDGGMDLAHAREEHPAWVERLEREGRLDAGLAPPPPVPLRILYFGFGYAMIALGLFLLVGVLANLAWLGFV